jgi:endonuclease/exonuclease/phosphatase (EEP) superfamily protein YafD
MHRSLKLDASVLKGVLLSYVAIGLAGGIALTLAGLAGSWAWWLDLWSHFPAQLAAGFGLLALMARLLGAKRMMMIGLFGLVVNGARMAPLYFDGSQSRALAAEIQADPAFAPGEDALRVLSFNVLTQNAQHDRAIAFMAASDADIIGVIEVDAAWRDALRDGLPAYEIAAQAPRSDNFGMLLLVRKGRGSDAGESGTTDPAGPRVISARAFDDLAPERRKVPTIEAQLDWAGRPLSLLLLHTMPPKTPFGSAMRNLQLERSAEWALAQEAPAIVMGDFNATPWSASYGPLLERSGLRDTARGAGFQPTWPYLSIAERLPIWPLGIPIDHVWHAPELVLLERRTGPALGSDHRSVAVSLAWRPGGVE